MYYELLLVYVDDILLISYDTKPTLTSLGKIYDLKEGSLGDPKQYLCVQIYNYSHSDSSWTWTMSSEKFIKNVVKTVDQLLLEDGDECYLRATALVPFSTS